MQKKILTKLTFVLILLIVTINCFPVNDSDNGNINFKIDKDSVEYWPQPPIVYKPTFSAAIIAAKGVITDTIDVSVYLYVERECQEEVVTFTPSSSSQEVSFLYSIPTF